jgi:hypothetical protein
MSRHHCDCTQQRERASFRARTENCGVFGFRFTCDTPKNTSAASTSARGHWDDRVDAQSVRGGAAAVRGSWARRAASDESQHDFCGGGRRAISRAHEGFEGDPVSHRVDWGAPRHFLRTAVNCRFRNGCSTAHSMRSLVDVLPPRSTSAEQQALGAIPFLDEPQNSVLQFLGQSQQPSTVAPRKKSGDTLLGTLNR